MRVRCRLQDRRCKDCGAVFRTSGRGFRYCESHRETKPERARRIAREQYWKYRDRKLEKARAYKAAHREELNRKRAESYRRNLDYERARRRIYSSEYKRRNPIVSVMGDKVRIHALPEEWQPIAHLILETRKEIKEVRRNG